MEYITCSAIGLGCDIGEIKNIKLLGVPSPCDRLTILGDDGGEETYTIEFVEHVHGPSAPCPYILLHVLPVESDQE